MHISRFWTLGLSFSGAVAQFQYQSHFERSESVALPPQCAISCLTTFALEYCGSLTNTTCNCGAELAELVQPCVYEACSVTDQLLVERYGAVSCGIPNNRSRLLLMLSTYYVIPAMTVLFIVGRVLSRVLLEVGLGPDDWMMIAAVGAYLIDISMVIRMTTEGWGEHTFWLSPYQITSGLKWFYVATSFYIISLAFIKFSILLFYLRVFPSRSLHKVVWALIVFTVGANSIILGLLGLRCIPIHGSWTNWMYKNPPIQCLSPWGSLYTAYAMDAVEGAVILVLPVPIIWRLQISWQKKATLLVMFLIGSIAVLFACIRMSAVTEFKDAPQDPSYAVAHIVIYSHIEQGAAIMCSCLPACCAILEYAFQRIKYTRTPQNVRLSISKNTLRKELSGRTFIELKDGSKRSTEIEDGMELVPDKARGEYTVTVQGGYLGEYWGNPIKKSDILVITETQQSYQ